MITRLHYTHIEHIVASDVHGTSDKDLLVLHETVSPDIKGMGDINGVVAYLDKIGYGIHGMVDKEGHKAWAYGLGEAIFYHAGGVNTRSCGIELVSLIPAMIEKRIITKEQGWNMWLDRRAQLVSTAQMISAWHNTDPRRRPLKRSNGNQPGVCSHWDVSQRHTESLGHWDCQPHDKGGHFPLGHVIEMAQGYAHYGYRF